MRQPLLNVNGVCFSLSQYINKKHTTKYVFFWKTERFCKLKVKLYKWKRNMLFFFNLFPSENMTFISCHVTPENVTWEVAGLHTWNALTRSKNQHSLFSLYFHKISNFAIDNSLVCSYFSFLKYIMKRLSQIFISE